MVTTTDPVADPAAPALEVTCATIANAPDDTPGGWFTKLWVPEYVPAASSTVPALAVPSPQVNDTPCVAPVEGSVNVPVAVTAAPSVMLAGLTDRVPSFNVSEFTVTAVLAAAPVCTSSVAATVIVSTTLDWPAGTAP